VELEKNAIQILAKASRATPRIANRLLKRSRDLAVVEGDGIITEAISREIMNLFEIDEVGLESTDRKILEIIIDKFNGGPVGIGAMAAAANEERETIEEVYEPYLMRIGFIERTPKGRMVTGAAYKHLNLYNQNDKQKKLME